ncbi:MAG: hypothetical protein U9R08_04230 [Nanoarchaeota archaeon]|nr:hypothetical protein [Nanoarchaeota archaeon]
MKPKKSQITMFIILGMIIIMIFGVMWYVMKVTNVSKIEQEGQKVLTETIQVAGLKGYIEKCLDISSEEALITLGRQGGNLYKFQGGNILPKKTLNINNNFVSYAITKPLLEVDSIFPPPWRYPLLGPLSITNYFGYLGESPFPGLCDQYGTNKPGERFVFPCPTYDTTLPLDESSVQEQLQIYIANKTKQCLNFSAIPNIANNIKEGTPNVTVTFGRDNIIINMAYPLEIKIAGKQPIVELMNFNTKIPIRLIKIFQIAQDIINKDNGEILFKVKEVETDIQGFDRFINIGLFERLCTDCNNQTYDTLLQIQDTKSILNHTPYVMQFMIENRYPILEWIGRFPITGNENIIILEGENLNFKIKGYDPDDLDLLTYKYIGWKQDFNEIFDYAQFELDQENNIIQLPEKYITKINSPQPLHWNNNANYPEEFPNSSIITTRSDVGPHNLTIQVRDESGLKDWQDLTILIADLPVVKAEAFKVYDDIPPNIASIEDYFQLNGQVYAAFTTILNAIWKDLTVDKTYTNLTQIIPESETPIDIKEIKTAEFTLPPQPHQFELTTSSDHAGTIKQYLDIDVKVCVPHRSLVDPIYPYNSYDDFEANHTCCADDYTLNTGTICYEENYLSCKPERVEIGVAQKAVQDSGNVVIDIDVTDPTIMQIIPDNFNSENDIYERTYTQKCGNRGNICSGEITDNWIRITECADLTGSETERCQGPVQDTSLCTDIPTTNCFNFHATTYEKNFNIPSATGICNTAMRCSSPLDSESSYDDGGYIECQATCYFGSCSKPVNCVCGTCPGTGDACNGLTPGQLSGQCSAGTPYFEDICTGECQYSDSTNGIFQCFLPGCSCTTNQCDGLTSDTDLNRCDLDLDGKTYFIDKCNNAATAIDKNNICNADTLKGCTASPTCHGITPFTILPSCSVTNFFPDRCTDTCEPESVTTTYKTIGTSCSGPNDCDNINRNQISNGNGWCYDDYNGITGNLYLYDNEMVDINGNNLPDINELNNRCDGTNIDSKCEIDWLPDLNGNYFDETCVEHGVWPINWVSCDQ